MKIYLDVCCLGRPFDEPLSDRVRLEAEAVTVILERCEIGIWQMLSSSIIIHEISQIPDTEKRDTIMGLQSHYAAFIELDDEITRRAEEFEKFSIKPFDALHLASAEKGETDVFLTTDDKFLKRAQKLNLAFEVANPLSFVTKEINE